MISLNHVIFKKKTNKIFLYLERLLKVFHLKYLEKLYTNGIVKEKNINKEKDTPLNLNKNS